MAHKEELLIHPKTREAIMVDETIAPIVAALWHAGVNTYCSCGNLDESGFGYIVLASPETTPRTFRADRKRGLRFIQSVSSAANKDVWIDYGPSGLFFRFLMADIPDLSEVLISG